MKKMILTPQKDTVTICLPPDWVGQSVVCILEKKEYEQAITSPLELHDVTISYNSQMRKRQSQMKSRIRVKRLRKCKIYRRNRRMFFS